MKVSIIVISKNEESLSDTLFGLEEHIRGSELNSNHEIAITVVDASQGQLAHIAQNFPNVGWINFAVPNGVRVSIPHQRNCGIEMTTGEIIVFTDSGCLPHEGWLHNLISPIVDGSERITCGPSWIGDNIFSPERGAPVPEYVSEAPTINLAFSRELAKEIGKFDESFEYGSDIDFTRRVVSSGTKIRYVADAVVEHDWGSLRRQLRRSRQYGAARIRLNLKHPDGILAQSAKEPVPVLFAIYIFFAPLVIRFRSYPLLLAIPLWRARKRPYPLRVVLCHLAEGVGCLQEVLRIIFGALLTHS